MATAKKKIQASEIEVGSRTLESVLTSLAEQVKANDARLATLFERAGERSAQLEERTAVNEERVRIALETIAAVSQDLRALTLEFREINRQNNERFGALEKAVAAE
jgi:hypothetical protein